MGSKSNPGTGGSGGSKPASPGGSSPPRSSSGTGSLPRASSSGSLPLASIRPASLPRSSSTPGKSSSTSDLKKTGDLKKSTSDLKRTGDLKPRGNSGSGGSKPATADLKVPSLGARGRVPSTVVKTPRKGVWPPSGGGRRKRKRNTALFAVVGLGLALYAYQKYRTAAQTVKPTVVLLGGGASEHEETIEITASRFEQIGPMGEIQSTAPTLNNKLVLDQKTLRGQLARSPGVARLRTARAGKGGDERTLIALFETLPEDAVEYLAASPDVPGAFTLTEPKSQAFSLPESGDFELKPLGIGPVFLDAQCKNESIPPGEWFLLYKRGAPPPPKYDESSISRCIDVCKGTVEACEDCRLKQANIKNAQKSAIDTIARRALEKVEAVGQKISLRSGASRFRLYPVDAACYGVVPRHDATLVGTFVVPLEPRPLELETPAGTRPIR